MFPSISQFPQKVGGYLGNIAKEGKQFGSAWHTAYEASGDYRPGAAPVARAANIKQNQAFGQLAGAIFQGRRYDDKTGAQIKG